MLAAAKEKGLSLIGFSEHSPRPQGFNYTHEYREQLEKLLPTYVKDVNALKKDKTCRVLLGIEMDWLAGQEEFIQKACAANPYDYIIGSVHFIDHWGFDDGREAWENVSQEICEERYRAYFRAWKQMLSSGFFQIAAHPDLIKIYSVNQFAIWLQKPEATAIIRDCLETLRKNGMAMEISSAGLRKACAEIYPHPAIMRIAAELELDVSMASDAHCANDVGADFDKLAAYARSFGFARQTIFEGLAKTCLPF